MRSFFLRFFKGFIRGLLGDISFQNDLAAELAKKKINAEIEKISVPDDVKASLKERTNEAIDAMADEVERTISEKEKSL